MTKPIKAVYLQEIVVTIPILVTGTVDEFEAGITRQDLEEKASAFVRTLLPARVGKHVDKVHGVVFTSEFWREDWPNKPMGFQVTLTKLMEDKA